MKTLLSLLLAAACGVAHSGTRIVPIEHQSILTPDLVTGHRVYNYYSVTADGSMLVCPKSDWHENNGACKDYSGANQWKLLPDVVPKGRVFVGYSVDLYRDNLIVYWK